MRHYRLITSPDSVASLKIRLYMQRRNVPFRESPASRVVLKAEILPRLKRVDIPVLITPSNETVQDSRAIIDYLEAREPGFRMVPESGNACVADRLMEMFADDWFAPAVSYAVWSSGSSTIAQQLAGTLYPDLDSGARERISRRLDAQVRARLGRQGLLEKTWPTRAARMTELAGLLDQHLKSSRFLFGDHPTVADCALAAPFQILWADTDFGAELMTSHPYLTRWMHAMNGTGQRQTVALDDLQVRESLHPVLRFAAAHALPHALGATEAVADWAAAHPGKINLPRSVGNSIAKQDPEGVSREFAPTTAWMLQRLIEAIDACETVDEDMADAAGIAMLEDYRPRRTMRHEHHKFRLNIDAEPCESPVDIHALAEPLLKARKKAVETRDLERLVLS